MKNYLSKINHSNEKVCLQEEIYQDFLKLRHNKDFRKDYKVYLLLKKLEKNFLYEEKIIEELTLLYSRGQDNLPLKHDLLFLQKGYIYEQPKLGERTYTNIEYYKALDADSIRKNTQSTMGGWIYLNNESLSYNDSIPIKGTFFNWTTMKSEHKVLDKELYDEINAISFSSSKEEIEKLLKNKIIIVSNCFLNYERLMQEYYNHFGMNPSEFVDYISLKYQCEIIVPKRETQSTKLVLYRERR